MSGEVKDSPPLISVLPHVCSSEVPLATYTGIPRTRFYFVTGTLTSGYLS